MADIDLWPISTLLVADMVFCVADIAVADMVCGRYRCNSSGLGAWAHDEREARACYGGLGTEPQSG